MCRNISHIVATIGPAIGKYGHIRMVSPLDFSWSRCFGSLCDSAMIETGTESFESDHPAIEFNAYWQTLADGNLPARKDLRPEEIRHVLRWMMILERLGSEREPLYVVRLHGTASSAMMYGNLTGRELSEFTSGDCHASRVEAFRKALTNRRPVFGTSQVEAFGHPAIEVHLGIFPFAGAAPENPQLVVVAAPDNLELRRSL